jgi:hypothetical protein
MSGYGSTLSARQYELIGRMTLSFNLIERMIEMGLMIIFTMPEGRVATRLACDGTFNNKANRFLRCLKDIAEEYPAMPPMKAIEELVHAAKKLAERRNKYVHARVVVGDWVTQEKKLEMREEIVAVDEKDISDLVSAAEETSFQIAQHGLTFLIYHLNAQRKARPNSVEEAPKTIAAYSDDSSEDSLVDSA